MENKPGGGNTGRVKVKKKKRRKKKKRKKRNRTMEHRANGKMFVSLSRYS